MSVIYLDSAATTKPCPEAVAAATAAMEGTWGNPSSVYSVGNDAAHLLESSRAAVAKAFGLGAKDGRIVFTGCGSESNNTAILGTVYAKRRPTGAKILTTDSEHPSVENAMRRLEEDGFSVVRIPTKGGALDLDAVRREANGNVILASFMLANNETGALYDVKSAAAIVREASPKAIIHTDAVQAFMKCDISPKKLGVDLISASAHKVYAPKGVGLLWVRESVITTKSLVPYIVGGGQERGYRSGTENLPGIAAFAAAVEAGLAEKDERREKVAGLYDMLTKKVGERLPDVRLNVPEAHLPYVVSMTLPGIKSETFLNFLSARGICVSAGSACSAHSGKPSSVLQAYGLTEREADTTLRVSLSHTNTAEEMEMFVSECESGIASLARMR